MITSIHKSQNTLSYRIFSAFIAFTFIFSLVLPPGYAQLIPASPAGGPQTLLNLPAPGVMVTPSAAFTPTLIKGLTIHPENPLEFDFIVEKGDNPPRGEEFNKESMKLVKYFLASLTVPEDQMWVNLSPHEKDRIISENLGATEMGKDMLAQDYILKQLTASLMYPENELGKKFWDRIYKKAYEQYGTTEIPMDTFNKVWIMPDKAVVYEHEGSVFVVESHLRVMLESDYKAMQYETKDQRLKTKDFQSDEGKSSVVSLQSSVSSKIIKEVILPEIEKEVNTGETFANLRQIYNSMILATWYKKNLRESLLGQVYVDKGKTRGVDLKDPRVNQKIYAQYLEAFKKGVYNYIKEDYDPATKEIVPRKYFSGGAVGLKESGLTTLYSLPPAQRKSVVNAFKDIGNTPGSRFNNLKIKLYEIADANKISEDAMTEIVQGIEKVSADEAQDLFVGETSVSSPVRIEGAPVDPAGVKFEGDVYIYNRSGQPIKLSEQAGQFFPKAPEGKPLVRDTVIVIKPLAGAAMAASPVASSPTGRKLANVVLALATAGMICLSGCGGPGPTTTPVPITKEFDTKLAVTWMDSQINPGTNLIRSFQNLPSSDPSFNVTWSFNQAQAIEGFLAGGQVSKAKQLADGLLALQRADGSWFNAYMTDTGAVAMKLSEQSGCWVGPNVVVGRALLDVAQATGEGKYAEAARKLPGWLDQFFVDRGSYGYLTGGEGIPWTSTEHNQRAMAFYDRLGNKARGDLIAAWLNTRMFAGDRYYVGYSSGETVITDPATAMDVQFLGPVMALHGGRDPKAFAGGIDWLLKHQTRIVYDNQHIFGIPRQLNVGNSIWLEGTSGLAAALQTLGRNKEADKFLFSLRVLQRPDGSLPAAIGGTPGWPGTVLYSSPEAVGPGIAAIEDDPSHLAKPLVSDGNASSPLAARQRAAQIRSLLPEIEKELANPGSGNLPEVAVVSDFHGGLNRFIMLLSDVLNDLAGFQGQLDPNRTIEEQLTAQGLSFKDIKGQIILGGDILDRGKHGIKIFLLIKELVEKGEGKVVSVTGNHDFWAFANLLGLHLPWYKGFQFYGDTKTENLIARYRQTNPELFDSPESVLWWTQRLAEHNADQDAYQKKAFDGKVKEVRNRFIEDYKIYQKNWTDPQKDAMEKFTGYFARIGVTDPYVGLNGLGKTSALWWKQVLNQINQGYEARRSLGAEDAELSVWQEAMALAEQISREMGVRLEQAMSEGKWWYPVFESINTHAYRSVEWSAKDWSSHKGWGDSVISEINEMIDAGLIHEEKLTQKNYIQSPTLQALARFYRENFNLYALTPYGDLFSHGGFPVNPDGTTTIFYKGVTYKGRDIFQGLDAVSNEVKDTGKSLKEIWEALHLVNTWYADMTTELKPNYIKRNIEQIGISKINKGIGVRHHVTGHNPIALGKLAGRPFMAGDSGYTHAFADFGMSEKYGGQGGWVSMGASGIKLRGFESETSDSLVDNPRTHVWDKETGQIKKTIENPGLEGDMFLSGAKEQLSEELARLSASSPVMTEQEAMRQIDEFLNGPRKNELLSRLGFFNKEEWMPVAVELLVELDRRKDDLDTPLNFPVPRGFFAITKKDFTTDYRVRFGANYFDVRRFTHAVYQTLREKYRIQADALYQRLLSDKSFSDRDLEAFMEFQAKATVAFELERKDQYKLKSILTNPDISFTTHNRQRTVSILREGSFYAGTDREKFEELQHFIVNNGTTGSDFVDGTSSEDNHKWSLLKKGEELILGFRDKTRLEDLIIFDHLSMEFDWPEKIYDADGNEFLVKDIDYVLRDKKSASSPVKNSRQSSDISRQIGPKTDDGRLKTNPGGIDLNPALLDLQIKRNGNGVPLPLPMQPIENMHIDGFLPVIINVTPVTNLPMLLGLADSAAETQAITATPDLKASQGPEVPFREEPVGREVEPVSVLN